MIVNNKLNRYVIPDHTWHQVRESNPGHSGGRRALSPLRQPCSPGESHRFFVLAASNISRPPVRYVISHVGCWKIINKKGVDYFLSSYFVTTVGITIDFGTVAEKLRSISSIQRNLEKDYIRARNLQSKK